MQLNILKKKSQKVGRRAKQTFLQRRHADANKHMKRSSTSLVIRETQIKATEVSPGTGQKGRLQKSRNSECWRGCGEKGPLPQHCQECKLNNHYGKQ